MTKINEMSNASKRSHGKAIFSPWNNKIFWTTIIMFIAIFLSTFRILDFPEGGSITFMGLFVLWLYTFFYGWKSGLVFSVVFGALRYLVAECTGESLLIGVPEGYKMLVRILEFPVAYGVFFAGGLLTKKAKKNSDENIFQIEENNHELIYGYLLGIFLQYVIYVTTAIVFYDSNGRGVVENIWYCVRYDAFALVFEAVLTCLVLLVPEVRKGIFYLKFIATHNEDENNL